MEPTDPRPKGRPKGSLKGGAKPERRWQRYSPKTVDIVRCARCEAETRYPGQEGYRWRRRTYSASRTEALCQKCFAKPPQS